MSQDKTSRSLMLTCEYFYVDHLCRISVTLSGQRVTFRKGTNIKIQSNANALKKQ